MDYGTWTLSKLKEELRLRGARISGRKGDLVERLESYDRNQDVAKKDVVTDNYVMKTPESAQYKDINSDTKLPAFSRLQLDGYLIQFNKVFDSKAKNLYEEKFLICVQSVEEKKQYFIKGWCAAEMRKAIVYNVDASLDEHGVVLECQCDCGAGMGTEAHCKHVCALLYALVDFTNRKSVIVQATCTSKLMKFHQSKKFKGSPMKAEDIRLRHIQGDATPLSEMSTFDPRPSRFRKDPGYEDYFRNTCFNFSFPKPIPIMQMFPPANLYAVVHDHVYLKTSPEEDFLQRINVSSISVEKARDIERKTLGQSQNRQWFEERSTHLQSSNFGRICKATDRTNFEKLARSIIHVEKVRSAPLEHGRKYESAAVAAYEKQKLVVTKECGIFVSTALPFMCSSPDRLVGSDQVVEVKCPFVARESFIDPSTVPYLYECGNELRLKGNHDYFYQIQGQLFCSKRKFCDFVVYTFKDIKIVKVERDDVFIESMTKKLTAFYDNYFRTAVLDKYFYHDYDKFSFD